MSSIIKYPYLNYNIGLNGGDNIMNIIFYQNDLLPNTKDIKFIIPELNEEYNILLLIGNNIIASDNVLLCSFKNTYNCKVIFIKFTINTHFIFFEIHSKINILYKNVIQYNNNIIIPFFNKNIDIDSYKLKFDLLNTIKIIKNKIKSKYININNEEYNILEEKLQKIINNINNFSNQKILEIKNYLKLKFFID